MNEEILTERLRIAPWSEDQAEAFFQLTRDDGFHAYPITIYRQSSLTAAETWIRDAIAFHEKTGLGKLGIWERSSGALIGMGGLTPWVWEAEELIDLTYRFQRSAWGNGYGTEAATSLVEYGFESLGLKMVTATITPDNIPSIKVARRLGMKLDKRIQLKGVATDLYRLPRENFIRKK